MRSYTLGILIWAALVGTALSARAAAPAETGGSALVREWLVREVLDRNPSIAAALAARQVAAERLPQARALEAPMASYEMAPLSLTGMRYGQELELRQSLPYPGTRPLRTAIASAAADASRLAWEALRLDLALTASQLYDDYWFVERAIEINDEHLRLLEEFRSIATARYAASAAPQQDPIRAEVEQAHLRHREVMLRVERDTVIAQLNALLHRAPDAPLLAPPTELPLTPPEHVELDTLLETARTARPEVGSAAAEIAARSSALDLARRAGRPELEAMSSYSSMWDEREHRWMIGVGFRVPLWRKPILAGIAEARAELERVEAERDALGDRVRMEVFTAWKRLEETHHVAELYRSRLLPASRDQVQAALSGFRTGQSGFLALIDAERNQRTVELDYLQVLADTSRRGAELERALGRVPGLEHQENATVVSPEVDR